METGSSIPAGEPVGQQGVGPDPDLGREFRRALWFAVICGLVYAGITQACTLAAMRGFRGEDVCDLRPTGWASAFELGVKIVVIDVVFFLYTIPSFMVRRWLGCALTGLFMLLTFGVAFMLHGHFVAARERGDSVELCRPWPYEPVRISLKTLDEIDLDMEGKARHITMSTSGSVREYHSSITVWGFDPEACAELKRLAEILRRKWPDRVRIKPGKAIYG